MLILTLLGISGIKIRADVVNIGDVKNWSDKPAVLYPSNFLGGTFYIEPKSSQKSLTGGLWIPWGEAMGSEVCARPQKPLLVQTNIGIMHVYHCKDGVYAVKVFGGNFLKKKIEAKANKILQEANRLKAKNKFAESYLKEKQAEALTKYFTPQKIGEPTHPRLAELIVNWDGTLMVQLYTGLD